MPLDPQARAVIDMLAALNTPPIGTVPAPQAREAFAARPLPPAGPIHRVEDLTIPGPSGSIALRIYHPSDAPQLPVLVWFHGGGWVLGTLDGSEHVCRAMANAAGCIVVSVDYRLAPEDKFPACADDCEAAYYWAVENATSFGGDPRRVAVGGDSAGGNLAAVVSLRAKEAGRPLPVFQLLVYPVTDSDFTTPSYVANAEGYMLTEVGMRWFWDQYVSSPSELVHPHAAVLRASDVSGLPPALVITAEFDPLRDEGEAYGELLRRAGVPVTITRYDGVIHGFFGMFNMIDKGRDAINESADALSKAFALQPA